MNKMQGKTPEETKVTMTELVLPNDVNLLRNLKGGRLMHLIDVAAAMAATRHAESVVATVFLDTLSFKHPIRLGEMVELTAKLVYSGNTSMHIKVTVIGENLYTRKRIITNEANLVFVSLDENERPKKVPPLIPVTEEEKADYKIAEKKAKTARNNKNDNKIFINTR